MKPGVRNLPRLICILSLAVVVNGCGGTTDRAPGPPQAGITVSLSPTSVSLMTSQTQQFQATVTGSSIKDVTWSVDNIPGGNASVGTISSTGLYTAPAIDGNHAVEVTSVADPTKT